MFAASPGPMKLPSQLPLFSLVLSPTSETTELRWLIPSAELVLPVPRWLLVFTRWITSIVPAIRSIASESAVLNEDIDLPLLSPALYILIEFARDGGCEACWDRGDGDVLLPSCLSAPALPGLDPCGEALSADEMTLRSSIGPSFGGGLGSRMSYPPRDAVLDLRSSKLVLENRVHQELLLLIG